MEAATTSVARVSRGLSFPGRRRERAAGERVATLFEQHGRMIYGVCRLLLRDAVEAEDAAQQTFLSAYRALLGGQEPREPSAWLGTIARNECRSRLRVRRTEPLALVTEPVGDELQREVGRREEVEALCAALAELPPPQRDAVVLREFYGLSYAEVAAALGLTGAAVESLLFRGRKRLQEQLRPVRATLGALTLPVTLQDSLAQALPGFTGGGASAGAGAAALAKLGSLPVVAKVAAATLAVGTVGTLATVEHAHVRRHHRGPSASVQATAAKQSDRQPAALVPATRFVSRATASPAEAHAAPGARSTRPSGSAGAARAGEGERHDSGSGGTERSGGQGGGAQPSSHESPEPARRDSTGTQRESGDTGHDSGSGGHELGSASDGSGDGSDGGASGSISPQPPPAPPPPPPPPPASPPPPPPGD